VWDGERLERLVRLVRQRRQRRTSKWLGVLTDDSHDTLCYISNEIVSLMTRTGRGWIGFQASHPHDRAKPRGPEAPKAQSPYCNASNVGSPCETESARLDAGSLHLWRLRDDIDRSIVRSCIRARRHASREQLEPP
jgi:hypothetical protein